MNKEKGPRDHCSHFQFSMVPIKGLFNMPTCISTLGKLQIMYLNNLRTKGENSLFFIFKNVK